MEITKRFLIVFKVKQRNCAIFILFKKDSSRCDKGHLVANLYVTDLNSFVKGRNIDFSEAMHRYKAPLNIDSTLRMII